MFRFAQHVQKKTIVAFSCDFLIILRFIRRNVMASSKEYLDFVLDQLSGLDEISSRAMMGEFIIYYRDKVVGGIYDNRFLVKPVESALSMMPKAELELPYEGGSKMLPVDDLENREFLHRLIESVYNELPDTKRRLK